MERLQNALHRAREKRSGGSGDEGSAAPPQMRQPRPGTSSTGSIAEVGARWAALKPFQPNLRQLEAARVVSFAGQQLSTPFDMMRTKLMQQAKAKGWRRIAVVSPTPKCGKTTIIANLAFSMSRQSEMRIMVIELDLRRPALAKLIGLKEPAFFSNSLAGQERPEDHIVCYGGNVAFATNNAPAANPAELLQSAKTWNLIAELEAIYQPDITLFDTAPLLNSDDTIGLLQHVDAAILVAAAETTTIEEIDVTESEISEVTEVAGVVLNKCRYGSAAYGYDYDTA